MKSIIFGFLFLFFNFQIFASAGPEHGFDLKYDHAYYESYSDRYRQLIKSTEAEIDKFSGFVLKKENIDRICDNFEGYDDHLLPENDSAKGRIDGCYDAFSAYYQD